MLRHLVVYDPQGFKQTQCSVTASPLSTTKFPETDRLVPLAMTEQAVVKLILYALFDQRHQPLKPDHIATLC